MIFGIGLFCSCSVTGYVFFEIMGNLYKKRCALKKPTYYAAFLLYVLLAMLVAYFRNPIVSCTYSLFAFCILSYLLYNTQGKHVVINSSVMVICFVMIDIIMTEIFSAFGKSSTQDMLKNPNFFLISGVADALALLCMSHFLIQLLQRCQMGKVSKILNLYMLILLTLEIVVLCHLLKIDVDIEGTIFLLLVLLGFTIVDGGAIQLFKTISQNAELEKQTELLKLQQETNKKYYEALLKRYQQMQKLMHDVKKHIQVISNLRENSLKKEYTQECIDYFDNIQPQFQCSDKILQVIIWDKIQECENENILFVVHVQDIDFDFMDNIEKTMLFVNLIDNSIEACKSSKQKTKNISLRIHRFKDYAVIKMVNTIGTFPIIKEGKLISTKARRSGLGMLILENIVNKYCGNLNYDYTDEYFETKIILSVMNKDSPEIKIS